MNAGPSFRAIRWRPRIAVCALSALALVTAQTAHGDEIRLKDGKKLYGVIVSYEDNMFKVKTDFGFVLVEKDKIASIVPSTPATDAKDVKKDPAPGAKRDSTGKGAAQSAQVEQAVASDSDAASAIKQASEKAEAPSANAKPAAKISNAAVRPSIPPSPLNSASSAAAPALKSASPAPANALTAPAASPAPPKEEPPANREEIQGNLYTNFTYGFHMYKAPSWNVLEDARSSLPNAIVALGTIDESTLMVVGREKSKENLDATAKSVEGRLREVYEDYRQLSQRKTTISGLPAQEFHYRGKADGHPWSGTLVVLSHGTDIFTVLGMTYADTDLIQIQENVIARAIASLDFNPK